MSIVTGRASHPDRRTWAIRRERVDGRRSKLAPPRLRSGADAMSAQAPDLLVVYRARRTGRCSSLPSLPIDAVPGN
jgi:hypothetical protein